MMGIRKGTVRDEPVCLEDVMPTVLEMAGVDCPFGLGVSPEWRLVKT